MVDVPYQPAQTLPLAKAYTSLSYTAQSTGKILIAHQRPCSCCTLRICRCRLHESASCRDKSGIESLEHVDIPTSTPQVCLLKNWSGLILEDQDGTRNV
jgi:hypothetical protein